MAPAVLEAVQAVAAEVHDHVAFCPAGEVVRFQRMVTITDRKGSFGDITTTGRTLTISGGWNPEKSHMNIRPARGWKLIGM